MDQIDRRILSILRLNARTPLKAIAEQTFLSSPRFPPALSGWSGRGSFRDITPRSTPS